MIRNTEWTTSNTDPSAAGGESSLNAGWKYLDQLARQMNDIREISKQAYINDSGAIYVWLQELRVLYDMTEFKTGLHYDKKMVTVKVFETTPDHKVVIREDLVERCKKYPLWFDFIEKMIELVDNMRSGTPRDANKQEEKPRLIIYKEKEVCKELSQCTRELYRDVNVKHLIMPEDKQDLKKRAKAEWIDRDKKKQF